MGAVSHTHVHYCAPSTHVTFGTSRRVRREKKERSRVPSADERRERQRERNEKRGKNERSADGGKREGGKKNLR